jgi:hypothetical protein
MQLNLDIPYSAPNIFDHMVSDYARFEIEPTHDSSLTFDILLPRAWEHSTRIGPVPGGVLQERCLCLFATTSVEAGSPLVAVTVTPVPFEIPVDAWLRVVFAQLGWHVVAGRWIPGPLGLFYDLTAVQTREGREMVRRSSARADGGRIICVNTTCRRDNWDSHKGDFWAAHATFVLPRSSGRSQMEPWLRVRATRLVFETSYPRSWSSELAESTSDDVSGIHIRLADLDQDKLYAYLLVRAKRKAETHGQSLATWLDEALILLERSGLVQTGELLRLGEDEDPRSVGIEGWRGGFIGEGRVRDAELVWRLGFVERENVLFTLASYSPKPTDDLLIALRAHRAFEIVRGGLTLLP